MSRRGEPVPIEQYLAKQEPASRELFEVVRSLIESLGPTEVSPTKSQVAFRSGNAAFAWAWVPAQYLEGRTAPLVLSLRLSRRDPSARWKQVVEPRQGSFMHHLEVFSAGDLDDEVTGWLREARAESER